jgi:uncharacterized protein (DUF1778 family)
MIQNACSRNNEILKAAYKQAVNGFEKTQKQVSALETEAVKKLLAILQNPVFRQEIARFSGNDYRDLGKIISEVGYVTCKNAGGSSGFD